MAKLFTKEEARKIVAEIVEKVEDYEDRMAYILGSYTEISQLFLARPGRQPKNTYSNPRLTEMLKAVNTFSKMEFRMLTSQKPFFDVVPMNKRAYENPQDLAAMQLYAESQLNYSGYLRALLRGLYSKNLFGTLFVEEPYEEKTVNFLGRKVGVTMFKPRSLLQTAFCENAYDIEDSEWVSFTDYTSKNKLMSELDKNKKSDAYYPSEELENCIKEGTPNMENAWIQQRLNASGYSPDQKNTTAREVISYYGTLDCINDGQEYYICIVNREQLYKASEMMGLRPVRIATHLDFELEPLGQGIGTLLQRSHMEMDNNRRKMIDLATFAAYNMFVTRRSAFDQAMLTIKPLGIIESDNPEDLRNIGPNPIGITATMNAETIMKQDFRMAAQTPDVLQATPSGETATEVALTSNAAVRNISVTAELAAIPLVKKHIQCVIENGQKYMAKPYTVSLGRVPMQIMPSQLLHDVDISIRTNTDTNMRPARLKNLMAAAQLMATTPPPPGKKVNQEVMAGINSEILRILDVPVADIYVPLTDEDMQAMMLQQALSAPQGQATGAGAAEIETPESGTVENAELPGGGNAVLPSGDTQMSETSNP